MLTSIRGILAASLLAGTGLAAAPALADETDPPSDFSITGNASIVSEYRFRGVDLSGGDIAIQGGVDVAHSSGIYIGAWGSSLDEDSVGYGHTELDIYAGWSGAIAEGLTGKVGVIYYAYPNAPAGDYDYVEFAASLGYAIGPVSTTVGIAYAPDQDSLGDTDNFYIYGDASFSIPETPVSLSAHIGYTDGFLTFTPDGNAFDWSVGAKFAITEKLSVGVSYVGVDGSPSGYNFTDDTVVGTLTVAF